MLFLISIAKIAITMALILGDISANATNNATDLEKTQQPTKDMELPITSIRRRQLKYSLKSSSYLQTYYLHHLFMLTSFY